MKITIEFDDGKTLNFTCHDPDMKLLHDSKCFGRIDFTHPDHGSVGKFSIMRNAIEYVGEVK